MRRFHFFLSNLIILSFISCFFIACTPDREEGPSFWRTENLRNGSVSFYRKTDQNDNVVEEYWNHTFVEFGEIILIQEMISIEEKQILRVRMDQQTLQPNYVEIVAPDDADQEILIRGETVSRSYFVENKTARRPSKNRVYYGREPLIEQEVMQHIMQAFPFESYNQIATKTIHTRREAQSETNIDFLGTDTIAYKDENLETYQLYFSATGMTAWYMKEAPHLLVKSRQGAYVTRLTQWNGI